jgi:hypothetical protein
MRVELTSRKDDIVDSSFSARHGSGVVRIHHEALSIHCFESRDKLELICVGICYRSRCAIIVSFG